MSFSGLLEAVESHQLTSLLIQWLKVSREFYDTNYGNDLIATFF